MAEKSQVPQPQSRPKLGHENRGTGTVLNRILGEDKARRTDVAAFQSSI